MKIALDPNMFRSTPSLELYVFAWEDRARESSVFMRETVDKYVSGW